MQTNVTILEQETQEKFGIVLADLHENSHQKVLLKCNNCDEIFEREFNVASLPHNCDIEYIAKVPSIRLECKILNEFGRLPSRSRSTDAGYDLHSSHDALIPGNNIAIIKTGIALACPPGYYYTIDGRSSLGLKGIVPFRGIIDATYTGEVVVVLFNQSPNAFVINTGDRIGQIILHRAHHLDITIVEEFSQTYDQRGKSGFGSSGR